MTPELAMRWRERPHHQGQAFITDGILDEEAWACAPRRVLFLLKEAYDKREEGFDLRWVVRKRFDTFDTPMWPRLGTWAYLLQNLHPGHVPQRPANNIDPTPTKADARAALFASAMVNVKKSDGKTRSNMKDICQHAKRDADLLREQVAQIQPDVIVACGTWAAAKVLWSERERISERVHHTPSGPLINFWHPGAQVHSALLYFSLAGLVEAAETKRPGSVLAKGSPMGLAGSPQAVPAEAEV